MRNTRAQIDGILASYPRTRPHLDQKHQAIYAEQYKINREGLTFVDRASQTLERWMHKKVGRIQGGSILEIGAGTLNHIPFERDFKHYDIVEPFNDLYLGKKELESVRLSYDSIQDVPEASRYQRIISIAVLEHLTDLPADVAKSALLLEEGGVFQCGIPSEGGLLWWLGWRFSTGIGYYLRTGLDYGVIMRHEHLNNAREIIAVIRHFFGQVTVSRFPAPFSQLSLYSYIEARQPRCDVARAFLESNVEGRLS